MSFYDIFLSSEDLIVNGDKYIDFYSFPEDNSLGVRVFNKEGKDDLGFIKNAYSMNKIAFQRGVSVAEPHELVLARLDENQFFGIVVDRLKGKTLDKLKGEDLEEARDSWIREVIKANKLGFSCNDSSRKKNAFWVPEKRETYLLDCDFWKYKGKGWGDF